MPEPNHTTEKLADFLENPPYQRRLVIFYDVLGWRNHIKAAGSNSEKIGNLRRLILRSHRSLRLRYPQFNMKISTFSDNIVITQAINDTTPRLLTLMAFQQTAVAMSGFLLRGGITVGEVVHDDECVFGPGLNRACELETAIAHYPRFALDRDVVGELGNIGGLAVLEDDVLFLDPFRLGFMDHMKAQHVEIDRDTVLEAGLPAPENKRPKYGREQMLDSILQALKPQIRIPMEDKDWNKLAWVYDRIAAQLGVPPAKSYRRTTA
jgi:hypothetical protein